MDKPAAILLMATCGQNQHPYPLPHPRVLQSPSGKGTGKSWQSDTSRGCAITGLPVNFSLCPFITASFGLLLISVHSQSLSLPNLNCLFSSRKNRNVIPRLSCLFLSPFLPTVLQLLKRGLFLHVFFESQTTVVNMVC